ncbi:MAG: hypothetical protein MUO82_00355 [Candidatus Thermoplasmatota archaeon]|nr:hypothetical protein [Candidatus Thermoplasmatota archaeon]
MQDSEQVFVNSSFKSSSDSNISSNFSNKTTLSPPYRNNSFFDTELLIRISEKKVKCGVEKREFYNVAKGNFEEYPIYCDNRSCIKCKDHKLYQYRKNHSLQIIALNSSMRNPRAWIFTGWVVPIEQLTKDFLRSKFKKLVRLLKQFSTSEFSAHMEIKVNQDGTAYLHFHVVSAYIRNIKLVSTLWARKVRNEEALKSENLGFYVSKYASKVPFFPSVEVEQYYTLLVYKEKMNIFSPKVDRGIKNNTYDKEVEIVSYVNDFTCNNLKDIYDRNYRMKLREKRLVVENSKPPPNYYLTELLEKEVEQALIQDSWVDNTGKRHFRDYHPFLYRNKEVHNE